jgi:hypothetical protein
MKGWEKESFQLRGQFLSKRFKSSDSMEIQGGGVGMKGGFWRGG